VQQSVRAFDADPRPEGHGPPLDAPRGFVSSKELSGSAQERASTRTYYADPAERPYYRSG